MKHPPSQYQVAIYDAIKNGTEPIVIKAVAGSGKTTTIIDSLDQLPNTQKVLFLAFNKHIVETLKDRVPLNVSVATLNSFGYQVLKKKLGWVKINADKTKNILWYKICGETDKKKFGRYCGAVTKLVALFKAYGWDTPTNQQIEDLAEKYEVDTDKEGFQLAFQTHQIGVQQTKVIDFDDQLFMPIMFGLPFPQYDTVFIDETQDLNPIQIEIVHRIGGRVIAVGDEKQAIYGFRGADPEALNHVIDAFNAKVLPLSICYRCAKSIVRAAQSVVPNIQYSEAQEEGVVDSITIEEYRKIIQPGDYVLCRTTAPLVQEALYMITQGRKACVLGREIGRNLLDTIKKISTDGVLSTDDITRYEQQQLERLKDREMMLMATQDQIDTIKALFYAYGPEGIEQAIESLFSDDAAALTYCTVHKAKGLERDNIFILKPELLPHPRCSQGWQRIQEDNLKYVAITRAKKQLHWVISEAADRPKINQQNEVQDEKGSVEFAKDSIDTTPKLTGINENFKINYGPTIVEEQTINCAEQVTEQERPKDIDSEIPQEIKVKPQEDIEIDYSRYEQHF